MPTSLYRYSLLILIDVLSPTPLRPQCVRVLSKLNSIEEKSHQLVLNLAENSVIHVERGEGNGNDMLPLVPFPRSPYPISRPSSFIYISSIWKGISNDLLWLRSDGLHSGFSLFFLLQFITWKVFPSDFDLNSFIYSSRSMETY